MCNKSLITSRFICLNPGHKVDGHDVGTELDFIPILNVPAFGALPSICQILTAASGTPKPCVPFPGPWQGTHSGLVGMRGRALLNSSYSFCVFGGEIGFKTSGQSTASLGKEALLGGLGATSASVSAAVAPAPPSGKIVVLDQGSKKNKNWNKELNKVPLEPNAKYLVGERYLYITDDEGRVSKARGVLAIVPNKGEGERYGEQSKVAKRKDGRDNPEHQKDSRSKDQIEKDKDEKAAWERKYKADCKKAEDDAKANNQEYKEPTAADKKRARKAHLFQYADTRAYEETLPYMDDGGHIFGSQFFGPGEQINYVPQHRNLNQARNNGLVGDYKRTLNNWFAMESKWATALREEPPKNVYAEMEFFYPNQDGSSRNKKSMRPDTLGVNYWIDGEPETKIFDNEGTYNELPKDDGLLENEELSEDEELPKAQSKKRTKTQSNTQPTKRIKKQ